MLAQYPVEQAEQAVLEQVEELGGAWSLPLAAAIP